LDDRSSVLGHLFQTCSEVHPASYSMGTGGFLPQGKPRRIADHSFPSSAEVKNAWCYTSTPSYVFMWWYLIK